MSNELDLVRKNVNQFLAVSGAELVCQETEDGPVAVVSGEEIPLLEASVELKLFQRAAVKPGDKSMNQHIDKFYFKDLEESFEELRVIPVCIVNYSRVMFESEYKAGETQKVICRSGNGITPSAFIDMPQNDICATVEAGANGRGIRFQDECPNAKWVNDSGERTKPKCPLNVTLGFLAIDLGFAPVHLPLHGKGMTAYNNFIAEYNKKKNTTRIMIRGQEKKSINDFVVVLKAETEGLYSVPKFELVYAPELNIRQYTTLATHYANTVFKAMRDRADRAPEGAEALAGGRESDQIETLPDVSDADAVAAAEAYEIQL